jgi:hypothetical protein
MTKNMSIFLRIELSLMLSTGMAYTQESTNSSGGDATGSGGTVAYSIGQVVYTTNIGSNGSLSQGVQQAYEIFNLGIKGTNLKISLTAFPNPTVDKLTLQLSGYDNEWLSYQLYDAQGKLLNTGTVTAQQTLISMSSLPPATYFMDLITYENKKIESFKIIKN